VPIRSSSPHRPQLDKLVRYASTPAVVSPVFSVAVRTSVIWTLQLSSFHPRRLGLSHMPRPPLCPQPCSNFAHCLYLSVQRRTWKLVRGTIVGTQHNRQPY